MFVRFGIILFVLTLFCLSAQPIRAQLTEAALKGVVKDSTGSSIANSSIAAKNESTGQVRSAVADDNGEFVMAELPPGIYTISVSVPGFKTFEQTNLKLNVGQTTELIIRLQMGEVREKVEVTAEDVTVPVATDGRLADNLAQNMIVNLPVAQRDVFGLIRLSAGATAIPGAANSTKLTNSPVVTVNGNRYRGNDYVLDGSMDTNPNNTGEPAIVPSLDSVEEVQVQTGNFSGEYGRGNGSVVNIRTKSGTNEFHGKAWEYLRNAAANARNFFATRETPLVFNQFGGNVGGPIFQNKTFFFGSYEGSRNANGQALIFQVETPEFRNYIFNNYPNGVAARLLKAYPAPTPLLGTGGAGHEYVGESDITTPQAGVIPAIGTASTILRDYNRSDQYLTRLDHSFHDGKDKLTARWIAESQRDDGGYSSSLTTLGQAIRGFRGPFDGFFGNLNLGYVHLFNRVVNDARFSFQDINVEVGKDNAVVPQITILGITAPFGDIFKNGTRLRTYELRDTVSLERGKHLTRVGFEFRKIFKGLSLAPPTAGTYAFNSKTTMLDFAQDHPFQQTLTVNPFSGEPTGFPRYFTLHEHGLFVQDDWKVTSRFTVNLGLRHDYFGTVSEKNGLLSSIIFGPGSDFQQRLATASIGHVKRLYDPQKLNFSPRVGLAYDPFGDGKSSIRAGFSLAFQPHHGQSISGARALPPDAIQGILNPSQGIGTNILYDIPVPFNPQFALGLNAQGGVPGLQITGFVVNPTIKTQYSESWFLNIQREVIKNWIVELGYVGTNGINLERIDDVNRFDGDLLDGKLDRINPNFGPLLFVTNGVTSSYNAFTSEVRHTFGHGLSLQANYRWSKWLDTASDTSTGQFLDNDQPGKGAENINCLRCERGPSMFDIPHRFTTSLTWSPAFWNKDSLLGKVGRNWAISALINAQSGRPFSVWNGASFKAGGDYNADGGGGAVGGGYYDRPNAPAPGTIKTSFGQQDFLNGLFPASAFPKPAPGTDGTLGRNTFRGPHQVTADLALTRSFAIHERKQLQFRFEAFNALNKVNLYLPNTDLSQGIFGKSTHAFDPRTLQASMKFVF